MVTKIKNLAGVILAGGKSRRFGEDKALTTIDTIPFYRIAINLLLNVGIEKIILIRNQNDLTIDYPIYMDIICDKGPLAGLYTAFQYIADSTALVLSCDMPALTKDIINLLISEHDEGMDVTIFENNGIIHPFPGIYSSNLVDKILCKINNNELSMRGFINSIISKKIINIRIEEKFFLNINRKEDVTFFHRDYVSPSFDSHFKYPSDHPSK